MTDLQLIGTKEILEELKSRFEHMVFAGVKTHVHKENDSVTVRRYSGNLTVCRGLCSELETDIADEHKRQEKAIEDY